MLPFLARRTVRMFFILLIASIVVFYSLRFAPGDPTGAALNPLALEEVREAYRHRLGLDRPVYQQYFTFLGNLVRGDLGVSIINGERISNLLWSYGKNSLILGLSAVVLTYGIGIPLGLLAAARRNTWIDHLTSTFAAVLMGIPNFWLALLLVYLFSSELRWLPSSGSGGWKYLVMPAIVLAAEGIAVTARMMRSAMLEQLGQDFVRTHRAKGLSEWTVVGRRVARTALIPVISLAGLRFGWLIGYALVVETIFRWPGIGYLLVDSVLRRDYPVAQFFSLVLVFVVVLSNLFADILYGLADPRVRV
ncbi:MAG: ABC transporter permease [Thermomicrobiales bacterium]|nr:ABC transporter permease [Thermomicrobiales bacterium]MCO5221289.1 ABC transporter permease [Thermomicrobiales bacterium]